MPTPSVISGRQSRAIVNHKKNCYTISLGIFIIWCIYFCCLLHLIAILQCHRALWVCSKDFDKCSIFFASSFFSGLWQCREKCKFHIQKQACFPRRDLIYGVWICINEINSVISLVFHFVPNKNLDHVAFLLHFSSALFFQNNLKICNYFQLV